MNIIDNFITLTKLPHCSKNADSLFNFLIAYANEKGYSVETDSAKNILIKKGRPTLALQAHYDMVCMGKAPNIETHVEEGWMFARDSSLGADNGMAIAMMMSLMERGEVLEFLLTSDEEIGLVGASQLNFKLSSKYMLNVDFEDEGIVCIGCAGGADIVGRKTFGTVEADTFFYEISVTGLAGGHSGVDIDKGIPNAIKLLAEYLSDKKVKVHSFNGGERRNSIPVNASVLLSSSEYLKGDNVVQVKKLDGAFDVYESQDFLDLLNVFKHGIHDFNDEFNLPDTSINLAIVSFEKGKAQIECSSRAMNEEGQKSIDETTLKLFKKYGFMTEIEDKYSSWKPEVNDFTSTVNEAMTEVFGSSKYEAIHAGLECGIILERYPKIKFVSIGPNIVFPHSTREKVELASVEKTFKVIERLIATL